jgi:hypothetical protein
LRAPDSPRLRYFGCANFFDPDPADERAMQDMVRRLGAHLRDLVEFRGVFTLDGILAEDGFLATEVNPRFGAALSYVLPHVALQFVNHALTEDAITVDVPELERVVLAAGRGPRWGGAWGPVRRRFDHTERRELEPGITLETGPSKLTGGFMRLEFDPDSHVGELLAPRVVTALAHADAEFDLGLGPLTAAAMRR